MSSSGPIITYITIPSDGGTITFQELFGKPITYSNGQIEETLGQWKFLWANPAPGYTFSGWSSTCGEVRLPTDSHDNEPGLWSSVYSTWRPSESGTLTAVFSNDENSHSLSVVSDHGNPTPSADIHVYDSGSSVTASVDSPVTIGDTVWTCTGWSGTGSVLSSGSDTSTTFVITQDSSIIWNWQSVTPTPTPTPLPTNPELVVTSLTWEPTNPSLGDQVMISYTVKNSGGYASDFSCAVYVDGERFDVSQRKALGGGETEKRSVSYPWSAIEGSHVIEVKIDYLDEVSEENENNNEFDKVIVVGNGVVLAEISSFDVDYGTFLIGETVRALVNVKNAGNVSWTFYVGYSIRDSADNWWDAPYRTVTLDSGDSDSLYLYWNVPKGVQDGDCDVRVAVWKGESEGLLQERLDVKEKQDAFKTFGLEIDVITETEYKSFGEALGSFTEYENTVDTHIYVEIMENANLVSSVSLEYTVGYVSAPIVTYSEKMVYQSDSTYYYRLQRCDLAESANGILSEFLASFFAGSSSSSGVFGTYMPLFMEAKPEYVLTKIIVEDVFGERYEFVDGRIILGVLDSLLINFDGSMNFVFSPVDVLVEDSFGRKVGGIYEMKDGNPIRINSMNEIPGAFYSENFKVVYIPADVKDYEISIIGLDEGDYSLVSLFIKDELGNFIEKVSHVKKGTVEIYEANIFNQTQLTLSDVSTLDLRHEASSFSIDYQVIGLAIVLITIIIAIGIVIIKKFERVSFLSSICVNVMFMGLKV